MNTGGANPLCPRCSKNELKPCLEVKQAFLKCALCAGCYFSDELDLECYIRGKRGAEAGDVYVRLLLASMTTADGARIGKRTCPICPRKLRHHEFGFQPHLVVLDRCELHGFWLDKEELETVLNGCGELATRG